MKAFRSFKYFMTTTKEMAICNDIQLFRQRLSHKSEQAYATMPIGVMGTKSLALID